MMIIQEALMHIRHKELLDEAERYRLVSNLKPSASRPRQNYARLMMWIGRILLNWGTWLTSKFSDKTLVRESGVLENRIQGIH